MIRKTLLISGAAAALLVATTSMAAPKPKTPVDTNARTPAEFLKSLDALIPPPEEGGVVVGFMAPRLSVSDQQSAQDTGKSTALESTLDALVRYKLFNPNSTPSSP
jgi:hypothetical protein